MDWVSEETIELARRMGGVRPSLGMARVTLIMTPVPALVLSMENRSSPSK